MTESSIRESAQLLKLSVAVMALVLSNCAPAIIDDGPLSMSHPAHPHAAVAPQSEPFKTLKAEIVVPVKNHDGIHDHHQMPSPGQDSSNGGDHSNHGASNVMPSKAQVVEHAHQTENASTAQLDHSGHHAMPQHQASPGGQK